MKKFVLKLDLQDEDKRRALKTVSTLSGIDEITIDVKGKKLTVIGTVDPVSLVSKLRKKNWPTDIISLGPAKEPEKKEEPKKEEPKKEEPKKGEAKEEPKKDEAKKEEAKEEAKKEEPKKEEEKKAAPTPAAAPAPALAPALAHELVVGSVMPYNRPLYPPMHMQYPPMHVHYPPPMNTPYYLNHHSVDENPNACVIC